MPYEPTDEVIEQIWSDMHHAISRGRVSEVARQVAADFAGARITAFIPIFVRRAARDRLLPEVAAA